MKRVPGQKSRRTVLLRAHLRVPRPASPPSPLPLPRQSHLSGAVVHSGVAHGTGVGTTSAFGERERREQRLGGTILVGMPAAPRFGWKVL